jgi:hypothetical protein
MRRVQVIPSDIPPEAIMYTLSRRWHDQVQDWNMLFMIPEQDFTQFMDTTTLETSQSVVCW